MALPLPAPPPRPVGLGPAEAALDRFKSTQREQIYLKRTRVERRMRITDLRWPLRFLEVPTNPENLRGRHEATHNRAEIDGATHEPMQFGHTKNTIIDLEFILDARYMKSPNLTGVDKVAQAMRFLESLLHPEHPDEPVIDTAPVARLEWPNFVEMNVVVNSFDWEVLYWTTWAYPLPRIVRCELQVEETRRTPIFARDVVTWGLESKWVGREAKLPKGIVLGRIAASARKRRSFGI